MNDYERLKAEALRLNPSLSEDQLYVTHIMKNPPETLPPLIPESTPKVKEKKDLKEIIITVDKYTWESLLIRLKQILKTCYLLSEDIPMSKNSKSPTL